MACEHHKDEGIKKTEEKDRKRGGTSQ